MLAAQCAALIGPSGLITYSPAQEIPVRTVSIFRNNRNQAIRLPKEFEFPGVTELTIEKQGDTILLRPVRPNWTSLPDEPCADADFLRDRPDLIHEVRFSLDEEKEDR
jgi:antitoxin VapB